MNGSFRVRLACAAVWVAGERLDEQRRLRGQPPGKERPLRGILV
jgi:hypothetical protein